jgi:hypothetical protein
VILFGVGVLRHFQWVEELYERTWFDSSPLREGERIKVRGCVWIARDTKIDNEMPASSP